LRARPKAPKRRRIDCRCNWGLTRRRAQIRLWRRCVGACKVRDYSCMRCSWLRRERPMP
jgi:hypothetical protein